MPPSYIRVRAVVWAYGRGQADTQTDTQTHTDASDHNTFLRRLRLTQNVMKKQKIKAEMLRRHI